MEKTHHYTRIYAIIIKLSWCRTLPKRAKEGCLSLPHLLLFFYSSFHHFVEVFMILTPFCPPYTVERVTRIFSKFTENLSLCRIKKGAYSGSLCPDRDECSTLSNHWTCPIQYQTFTFVTKAVMRMFERRHHTDKLFLVLLES